MPLMPDLSADIATQAVEPASVTSDGQAVSNRPVADLIAADQYAGAGATAAGKRRRGIVFTKLTTPGASGLNPSDVGTNWGRNG